MTTANTKDCIRECIGRTVRGVLFDAFPPGRSDIAGGTKALVLDDGRAIVFADNGAFWMENRADVERAIARAKEALQLVQSDLADVLTAAGEKS